MVDFCVHIRVNRKVMRNGEQNLNYEESLTPTTFHIFGNPKPLTLNPKNPRPHVHTFFVHLNGIQVYLDLSMNFGQFQLSI